MDVNSGAKSLQVVVLHDASMPVVGLRWLREGKTLQIANCKMQIENWKAKRCLTRLTEPRCFCRQLLGEIGYGNETAHDRTPLMLRWRQCVRRLEPYEM